MCTGPRTSGLPSSQYSVKGVNAPKDSGIVGLGLKVSLSNQFDASINYDGEYNGKYSDSSASLRIEWKF